MIKNLGNFKIPKNIKLIHNFNSVWQQFCMLKYAENIFKNQLLDELIAECNINHSKFLQSKYGKQSLITQDFGTLQKCGLVLDHSMIVKELLSNLEPFPFDDEKLEKIGSNRISIGKIRNVIEKQYLMWKYQVDEREMKEILFRFKYCLYPFRSIRNLRKSISLLESMSEVQERNIAETIYLVNQKPFNQSTVKNFEKEVVGINWSIFPHYCRKILRHSHQYILFIVSFLRQLEFTDTQIRAGLPFLHLPFKSTVFRLNGLLENPEISEHRKEEFFLHLLYFSSYELSKLVNVSFTELIEIVKISVKHRKEFLTLNKIRLIVLQFYDIENCYFKIIPRYPKYKLISEKQMHDTLFFLKENNFASKEVAESITIIFYPRNLIAKTLKKIQNEESTLKKFGFNNGCVSKETNFFANGTKEKRKTLQLCLYYMEKSFYISGNEMMEVESVATKTKENADLLGQ